jgi:predicted enzyme related to lactoylglutathione lyase
MREVRKAKFSFTKLIVDDEERMAAYYREVYGLHVVQRVRGESGATGESFREVIMGPDGQMSPDESLVMFKFTDRAAPRDQESILGFTTDDLDALVARISANGGKLVGQIESMPQHGIRVVFATDPEGHLSENVQMVPS